MVEMLGVCVVATDLDGHRIVLRDSEKTLKMRNRSTTHGGLVEDHSSLPVLVAARRASRSVFLATLRGLHCDSLLADNNGRQGARNGDDRLK